MTLETQELVVLLAASLGNGFVGGLAAFWVALRQHRRKDVERQQQERIAAVRNDLDRLSDEILGRPATVAEQNFYMPRLLSGEMSERVLTNLLHVERQAVDHA